MKVLIITRKGVVMQVFYNEEEFILCQKAETLDDNALFWTRFAISGEYGASSRSDDEKTYLIKEAEAA